MNQHYYNPVEEGFKKIQYNRYEMCIRDRHHPEGVDLMPADIQLSGMEVSLVNAMSRETILRQYLDTLRCV